MSSSFELVMGTALSSVSLISLILLIPLQLQACQPLCVNNTTCWPLTMQLNLRNAYLYSCDMIGIWQFVIRSWFKLIKSNICYISIEENNIAIIIVIVLSPSPTIRAAVLGRVIRRLFCLKSEHIDALGSIQSAGICFDETNIWKICVCVNPL